MNYSYEKNIESHVADLISKNKIVFWFQGRMEFGPRALGNRSILAIPSSIKLKNDLNLKIKKRVWYQPFCPSILKEEGKKVFSDYDQPDKFMTMGYMTKKKVRDKIISVINIDGSSRPQMVGNENTKYRKLLKHVKKKTGLGVILNTSFNLHGYPIVNNPGDAIAVMKKSKTQYMAIGNYLVKL